MQLLKLSVYIIWKVSIVLWLGKNSDIFSCSAADIYHIQEPRHLVTREVLSGQYEVVYSISCNQSVRYLQQHNFTMLL